MNRPTSDVRAGKSRQAIEKAFLQLLPKYKFEHIKVKEIIDLADVNRSTFYAHYLDKYDLLDQMQSEIIDNLQAIIIDDDLPRLMIHNNSERLMDNHDPVEDHIIRVLQYIKKQASTIRLLTAHDNGQAFRGKLIEMISGALNTTRLEAHINNILKNYVAVAFSGLSSSIIFEWIESDFALTEREICQTILKLNTAMWEAIFD